MIHGIDIRQDDDSAYISPLSRVLSHPSVRGRYWAMKRLLMKKR